MKQLVGQPVSHSNDQVEAALSHKILKSELKLKAKSSPSKQAARMFLAGRVDRMLRINSDHL